MGKLIIAMAQLMTSAVMWLSPQLSRREMLFSVRVGAEFRKSDVARRAVRSFRIAFGAVVIIAFAATLAAPIEMFRRYWYLERFVTLAVFSFTYWRQHQKLKEFAAPVGALRGAVEISPEADRLPAVALLGIGPVILLLVVAIWLWTHWDAIPARFPVHFDMDGNPNRWVDKTVRQVYGALIGGVILISYMMGAALAIWHGARRSSMRGRMIEAMTAGSWLIGVVVAEVGLLPLYRLPAGIGPWLTIGLVAGFIGLIIWRGSQVAAEPAEPTPDEYWSGAMFYRNPNDAALFVEKREGMGYTMNFAHPAAWPIVASPILPIGLMWLLLR